MCGRFTLLANEDAIRERFQLTGPFDELKARYNIAPTDRVFAIIHDGRNRRAGYIHWGLVPFWAKDPKIASRMINARVETVHQKPSFKHLLERKRCLIVADSFYEWQKNGQEKTVHRIQVEAGSLFAFAGLWDKWEKNGEKLFTCTMLTREANDFMRPIHHRMPIILPLEEEETWLSHSFSSAADVQRFASQVQAPELSSYPVSNYVNKVQHDDAACIQPI